MRFAATLPPSRPASSADPLALHRAFFRAAIVVVLTAGAVWGAYLLLRIGWAGTFRAAGLHEVNAHGHAQIFGWVGLFVMGFAYQIFPRFKGVALAWPALAWASLALLVAGLVGRSVGEPLAAQVPGAGTVAVASAWLEAAAVALFVAIILATWRAAPRGLEAADYYVLAALGWFAVQAVFEAVYLQATLAAASRQELLALVVAWQGALRDVQIHGFALLMILGVSQRLLPGFYGLRPVGCRLSLGVLACLNLALAGEVVGLVLMRGPGHAWAALWYGSALLLSVAVAVLVVALGVFGRVAEPDRSLKFLRAAYAWLLFSLAMLVLLPAYQFALLPWLAPASPAATAGFSHAYYGAVRHAITVGFISLMIVGVASRVVPDLNGLDADRLTALWGPFLLLNAGCALRVVAQTLTDLTPYAFPVAGVSGLLEVTALALWGAHLWAVMAGRARYRLDATVPYVPGTPIEAGHLVGEVLACHPELREALAGAAPGENIGQACRRLGRDAAAVVAALNRVRDAGSPPLPSLPLVAAS